MYTQDYDSYGQDLYETEEERRRRLAAEQPVTQKITYNPDGTQKMTISGTPEALSSANPFTPTVTGPVNPAEIMQAQMPQAQVPQPQAQMPGQTQPSEVDDYIRRLYERSMPGFNPNAPMGEQAMAQSPAQPQVPQPIITDQGQVIGRETPQQMITGAETNAPVQPVAPQAPQTGMMPVNAPAPQPQPQPQPQPSGYGPGVTFEPGAQTQQDVYAQRLVDGQQDPIVLAQIRQDTNAPAWAKQVASNILYDQSKKEVEEQRARTKIQSDLDQGKTTDLARAFNERKKEGSWPRYILAQMFGSDRLVQEEAMKLGIKPVEYRGSVLGSDPTMIAYRADGLPVEGWNTRTGKALTAEELATSAANTAQIKGAQPGQVRIRDERGGEWNVVQTPQGPIFYDNGGRRGTPQGRTVPITAGSDVVLQNELQIQRIRNNIQGMKAEERIKTIESVNRVRMAEGLPLFSFADVGIDAKGNLLGVGGAPAAAPAPQAKPAGAPPGGAPATRPQATPSETGGSTAEIVREREARGGARKEIAKTSGEVVAASQETQNLINKIDNTIVPILNSGQHNIGPGMTVFQGRGPVAQAIGGQFETEDARNTRTVMETIDMLAIEGLKSLGANPSTRDLEFYTKNKPQANSDPEFVKSWIQSRSAALKRKLGYAGGQVEAGGAAGVAPPVQNKPSVSNW